MLPGSTHPPTLRGLRIGKLWDGTHDSRRRHPLMPHWQAVALAARVSSGRTGPESGTRRIKSQSLCDHLLSLSLSRIRIQTRVNLTRLTHVQLCEVRRSSTLEAASDGYVKDLVPRSSKLPDPMARLAVGRDGTQLTERNESPPDGFFVCSQRKARNKETWSAAPRRGLSHLSTASRHGSSQFSWQNHSPLKKGAVLRHLLEERLSRTTVGAGRSGGSSLGHPNPRFSPLDLLDFRHSPRRSGRLTNLLSHSQAPCVVINLLHRGLCQLKLTSCVFLASVQPAPNVCLGHSVPPVSYERRLWSCSSACPTATTTTTTTTSTTTTTGGVFAKTCDPSEQGVRPDPREYAEDGAGRQ